MPQPGENFSKGGYHRFVAVCSEGFSWCLNSFRQLAITTIPIRRHRVPRIFAGRTMSRYSLPTEFFKAFPKVVQRAALGTAPHNCLNPSLFNLSEIAVL